VPQWFKDVHTVAYWDVYSYPDPALSPFALGTSSYWWWDAEKAAKLEAEGAL
jgi:microcin C transport system substrate-binding protein